MKKLLCIAIVALSLVGGAGRASADPGTVGATVDLSAGGTAFQGTDGVTWESTGPVPDAGVTWE